MSTSLTWARVSQPGSRLGSSSSSVIELVSKIRARIDSTGHCLHGDVNRCIESRDPILSPHMSLRCREPADDNNSVMSPPWHEAFMSRLKRERRCFNSVTSPWRQYLLYPVTQRSSCRLHLIVLRNVHWCGIKLFQLLLESEKIVYFLNALSQRLFCFKALGCKVPTIKPGHISRWENMSSQKT